MHDVTPIAIGPRNCEQMTGHTWRWLRDHAAELGVEVLRVGGKPMILAAPLLAALEARATVAEPETTDEEIVDLDSMRTKLGKRRVG